MKDYWVYLLLFVFIPFAISIIVFLVVLFKSPFKFPYAKIQFDVSGVRKPKIEDYIDKMLISYGMDIIDRRMLEMFDWKKCSLEKIKKSVFKKIRKEQFEASLDWENAFVFIFTREQTRYRQVNYVKHPYIVVEEMSRFSCPYEYIKSRFNQLEAIGFETILSEYHSKRQRNLMTKDLRDKIALRDNYTCQICGKYMPDGVGLHIDHIIPVSKGGKSIPSNLQVLCSKCNGKKSGR